MSELEAILGTKGEVARVAALLLSSGDLLFKQGKAKEAEEPYRQALAIFERAADRTGVAQCSIALGRVLVRAAKPDEALPHFNAALDTFQALDDPLGLASVLDEIGDLHRSRGEIPEALRRFQESYALRKTAGDERGLGRLLISIASVHRAQGDYELAIAKSEEARTIFTRLEDREGAALVLVSLGNVTLERGDHSKAIALLKEAQAIWEALGNREQSASVLNSIASIYSLTGDHAKAKEFFTRTLAIFEEMGHIGRMAGVLNNLGVTAKNLGLYAEGVQYYERSIALKSQLGGRGLVASPLINLGNLNYMLGNFTAGLERCNESLEVTRETGDRRAEINARLNIANCLGGLAHWEDSLARADEAVAATEELGVKDLHCDALLVSARARLRLERYADAEAVLSRTAEIARKLKDPEFEAVAESMLGELAWWRGERAAGDTHFMTAVGKLGRLESKHHLGLAYLDAGRCYGAHGEAASAVTYLERAREIFTSLGARGWIIATGLALGRFGAAHDPVGAAFALSEALELAEEAGDLAGQAEARERLRTLRAVAAEVSPGSYLSKQKLTALYQVGSSLNQILELETLIQKLLDLAVRNAGAERGALKLEVAEGRPAIELARSSDGETLPQPDRIGRDIREEVIRSGAALLARDPKSDELLRKFDSVKVDGATSFLCVPLKIKERLAGSLYLDNRRPGHLFSDDDLDFLVALGNVAAPAIENARLVEELRQAKELLDEENVELRREVSQRYQFDNFVGSTPAMEEVFAVVGKVARSRANVLIRGESGTGKELVAKTIHYNSDRSGGPFVKLNCAALPESLVESELFGVERGTATGVDKRIGKFEQANHGTLFLDEIGDMPLTTQAKVLRVLQEKEFERVGGRQSIAVDVRVLSATHKDLEEAIKNGEFRADLYYRLNVVPVSVPPLRRRRGDIPALVKLFLDQSAESEGKHISGLTRDAWEVIQNHPWPGNVRELQNVIAQAVVMCDGDKINAAHLPAEIRQGAAGAAEGGGGAGGTAMISVPAGAQPLDRVLEAAEEAAIKATLERVGGNKSRAADELGISRVTLYNKLKKYGIE
jgi:Nif-specific regulatory protein